MQPVLLLVDHPNVQVLSPELREDIQKVLFLFCFLAIFFQLYLPLLFLLQAIGHASTDVMPFTRTISDSTAEKIYWSIFILHFAPRGQPQEETINNVYLKRSLLLTYLYVFLTLAGVNVFIRSQDSKISISTKNSP